MGKVYAFLLGLIAGFGLCHVTSSYHVVRAADGLHVIGKTEGSLSNTYVDVRDYQLQDWLDHPKLAAAIVESDDEELKKAAVDSTVEQGIRRALDLIPRSRPQHEPAPAPHVRNADIPAIDVPAADANGTE